MPDERRGAAEVHLAKGQISYFCAMMAVSGKTNGRLSVRPFGNIKIAML
jgi:hypothetical protein